MFCRNCGHQIQKGQDVCYDCGFKTMGGVKYCQACGGETSPDQKNCNSCGAKLIKDECKHCGGNNIFKGASVSQSAEVGAIGPSYKDGSFLLGVAPMFVDICQDCGEINRLYIKDLNHKWYIKRY